MRFHKSALKTVGVGIVPTSIVLPGQSVNRDTLCKPLDVLEPNWKLWGVAYVTAGNVKGVNYFDELENKFSLFPEHKPVSGNSSHSEIQVELDSVKQVVISDTLKKYLRTELAKKFRVYRDPK